MRNDFAMEHGKMGGDIQVKAGRIEPSMSEGTGFGHVKEMDDWARGKESC